MSTRRRLLIPAAVLILAQLLSAQTSKQLPASKPPQLKLEIVPLKRAYYVGETVLVKYKLTSLVDGTLCFDPPAVGVSGGYGGSLTTDVIPPPKAESWGFFIEHFWPVRPNAEELRRQVANRWIRLGMSEPFTPKAKARIAVLSAAGEWILKSTYNPPDLTSGEKAIVESLGCTPADVEVHSEPVTITVIDAPK